VGQAGEKRARERTGRPQTPVPLPHSIDGNDMNYNNKPTAENTVVLTVQDKHTPGDIHLPLSGLNNITSASYDDISPALLAARKPDLVVSMALAGNFDCLDLAMILQASGYVGSYLAIALGFPVPGIVIREVNALCPELDFDIIDAAALKPEYRN
jgi:hypothetical protein